MATIKCDDLIQRHLWENRYKSTLQALAIRDYGKPVFRRNAGSLDPDRKEQAENATADRTMDAVIGICDYDPQRKDKNTHGNHELLMVEFKFDMQKKSAKRSEELSNIAAKASHTREMLKDIQAISKEYCVLFAEDVKSVFQSNLNRRRQSSSKYDGLTPMTSSQFESTYLLDESDFPYWPQTDLTKLKNELSIGVNANEILSFLENWRDKIREQTRSGHLREAYVLQEEIAKAWSFIDMKAIDASQDDEEIIGLVLNEIKAIPSRPTPYKQPS